MFSSFLQAAQAGPVAEAELLPLSNQGRLRVTYNWLYSALNCDPNDNSTFLWVVYKLDNGHVALSPKGGYGGRTLYASVRDDWNYYVQTQAPHSADWITAIGRDEILTLSQPDLFVRLQGFNGLYLSVNANMDAQGNHSGYRVMSSAPQWGPASTWFLRPVNSLQAGLALPPPPTAEAMRQALSGLGQSVTDATVASLLQS
ncbi:hypothetical protein [Hymenobacter jeollabukensis]|uniref:Uncharacterized protein n=1 Tax=Hymenobacter jeollabukensis TaxID=2025313 RepID=A0A5R8WRW4_9BACT|nr:hypothetical protein [Hymenobacter jeollabukensis]TLM93923.1 hypothetical protein FDY95_07775 [Hymenobacter jeollabukensis]